MHDVDYSTRQADGDGVKSVLIVEDSTQLAQAVREQLEAWHGYSVTCVRDPDEMLSELAKRTYDLALVDLLFEHISRDFNHRRLAGQVWLSAPPFLVTGLTALRIAHESAPSMRTVVWTSGEANRRLHLLYAYEVLGERIFCSKSSGAERAQALADALSAAGRGVPHIDPVLNAYLPTAKAATLAGTILREPFRRAVWRAIALGAHTRAEISRLTGYSPRYIGNEIPEMYADLRTLDPGLPESRQPLIEVVRYAATNWEFFLDEAVRHAYP